MLDRLIDTTLDVTVAPGFSRIGYAIRSRSWADIPRLDGRTVAVTGATAGLGRATAAGFARLGADVILLVRDRARGAHVAEEIGGARVVECDLADLRSVRAAARQIDTLHVLVNNAGVLPAERTLSRDGFELTFATNVLGMFALTERLLGVLRADAPARIVNVSSGGMYSRRLDLEDLQATRGGFDGVRAYALTKRAEVVLTKEWARRLAGTGVTVHAMHPGWADTPGVQSSLPRFRRVTAPILRTAEQGADTILWLAAADEPAASSGGFWHDRRLRPEHRLPTTRERPGDAERLYEICRSLTAED